MKLVIVGASGYGNVGDDAYRDVFSDILGREHQLIFESPYPDLRAVKWADIVVVGGGGVVYCNQSAHFEYMKQYMDEAMRASKPLCFLSCGIQEVKPSSMREETLERGVSVIAPWAKYLSYASLITMRSLTCVDIIKCVVPDHQHVHYAPDACYLLQKPSYHLVPPETVVVVPTTTLCKHPRFSALWQRACRSDSVCVAAFAPESFGLVDQLVGSISRLRNVYDRKHLSPQDAMAILQDASEVITGRYHGAVLARACGVPEQRIHMISAAYKSAVEVPPADRSLAIRHADLFNEMLVRLNVDSNAILA